MTLEKIEGWLKWLGLTKIEKQNGELIVRLKIDGNIFERYVLHISITDDMLVIESFFSKNVSGDSEKVKIFQKALLGYGGAVNRVYFALVSTIENGDALILRSTQSYNSLDVEEFKAILDSFHDAFTHDVPKIKGLAKKLGLRLDGRDSIGIDRFLDSLFG